MSLVMFLHLQKGDKAWCRFLHRLGGMGTFACKKCVRERGNAAHIVMPVSVHLSLYMQEMILNIQT